MSTPSKLTSMLARAFGRLRAKTIPRSHHQVVPRRYQWSLVTIGMRWGTLVTARRRRDERSDVQHSFWLKNKTMNPGAPPSDWRLFDLTLSLRSTSKIIFSWFISSGYLPCLTLSLNILNRNPSSPNDKKTNRRLSINSWKLVYIVERGKVTTKSWI